ncbi:MAG: hypothetical protein AB7T74_13845 [Clostridia bacterium]
MDTIWTVNDLQRLHEMGVTRRRLAEVLEVTDRQARRLLTKPAGDRLNVPHSTDALVFAAALGKPTVWDDAGKLEYRNRWKTGHAGYRQEMARPLA